MPRHVYIRAYARFPSSTNIEIEDDYVRIIMDCYGVHTKTEAAVDLALHHLAGQPMTREEALALRGARAIGEVLADVAPAAPRDPRRYLGVGRVRPRHTGSPVDERVAALIAADGPLAVTEPVIMEVVAGARSTARAHDLRRLMLRGGLLHFDAATDFDAAALIYRRCPQAGFTPAG